MNNIQAHLKKIRSDAAECLMLSSLATDGKGEVFLRIGEHLNGLALELERSTRGGAGANGASQHEEVAAVNVLPVEPKPAARSGRLVTWLLIVAFGVISGAAIWANDPADKYRSFMMSKREPAPQDNSNEAAVRLLISDEQAGRKLLSEQVTALAGRLDDIAGSLDSLKKGRAEITEPPSTGSASAEAKPAMTENPTPPAIEKPVATAENRVSTAESSASLNQPDTVGPRGCTLFRSFDARSGTYVTLDGRRRQCR
jgi:BA14K-like protein